MRLDVFLVKNKFVASREKAQFLIKNGFVEVDGKIITKSSKKVFPDSKVRILKEFEYVGRGGYKLKKPVEIFKINFKNKIGADVGCSKGGFTDFVLKRGAKKVYAIDLGDPLDSNLKKDKRIFYLPFTDARKLKLKEKIDFCLIDVTFTSLKEILPVVKKWLKRKGIILALIKPPFEVSSIKKLDPLKSIEIVKEIIKWCRNHKFKIKGVIRSEIKGKRGKQIEFFIFLEI